MLLSDELKQVVHVQGDQPIELVDPDTQRTYVLLPREVYDRLAAPGGDALSESERRKLLRDFGLRAGWDDPQMDAYDRYDEIRAANP
jgi:hypothetical protein